MHSHTQLPHDEMDWISYGVLTDKCGNIEGKIQQYSAGLQACYVNFYGVI